MRCFASLDENNVVIEVLSFSDELSTEYILERFGKVRNLVETFDDMEGGISREGNDPSGRRYRYARIGSHYIPELDVFTPPKPSEDELPAGTSLVWDESQYAWFAQYDDFESILQAVNSGDISVSEEILNTPDTQWTYL